MRISDWSSDVCSSDLEQGSAHLQAAHFVFVPRIHGDIEYDRAQRVEPEQHVRLEEVAFADPIEWQPSRDIRMDCRIAVGRVEDRKSVGQGMRVADEGVWVVEEAIKKNKQKKRD